MEASRAARQRIDCSPGKACRWFIFFTFHSVPIAMCLCPPFGLLQGFFDEYVAACLLWMKINVIPIVPVEDMALVQVRHALSIGADNVCSRKCSDW